MTNLTAASHEVFMTYAYDAGNWSGNPWVSVGNIQITKEQRGNLSDLVKKGLIQIQECGWGQAFIEFTEAGKQYAAANDIDPTYWN